MAVADLVAEWFDTELLRATIAAQGIFGTFLGPWSAGSGATLLLRTASDGNPAGGATYVKRGTGALTTAMAIAAQAAGVEIRTDAEVAQIKVKDGAVAGLVLEQWRRDRCAGRHLQRRSQTDPSRPRRSPASCTQFPAAAAELPHPWHSC